MGKNKKKQKYILISFSCLIAVLLILWVIQFAKTNCEKYDVVVETFEMGETVEMGENFFSNARENSKGYSVKINDAKLVEYKDYLESNGGTLDSGAFSEGYPAPKYTCLLDVTIKNSGNTDGAIMVLNYALYDKSLKIPVDFELWGLIDKKFTGEAGLRLLEDSEVNLTIPFTPMNLDAGNDAPKLEAMMLQDDFLFCVCEFPVRKMVKVNFENQIDEK